MEDDTAGSISESADLVKFSHTTNSRVYREWSEKKKISSENASLIPEVRGKEPDCFELVGRQQ